MTDDSYLLDGKDKTPKSGSKWLGRLTKFIFFLVAFGLIILTILYNMGGSNDMLKEGVVNTISGVFNGRHVKLKRLNHMGFFPSVALDVEGVNIYQKEGDRVPVVEVRKFEAYMPFWNVATRSPQLSSLYIEGVRAIRGFFFPEELYITKVYIDHDRDEDSAKLKGSGTIGAQPWSFEIGLKVNGISGKYTFELAENSDVVFDIGDVHFDAQVRKEGANYLKISEINLVHEDKKVQGELVLSGLPGNLLKVKGELLANGGSTVLMPELVFSMVGRQFADFSGDITATKFVMSDLFGETSVFAILDRFNELLGYKQKPQQKNDQLAVFGGNNFDVKIVLENAQMNDIKKDKIAFKVSQSAGNLRIGDVTADDEVIMPPVMLLYDYTSHKVISVFQDGHFDSSIMTLWLKNIPKAVLDKGYLDIDCGLGEFHYTDQGLDVDSFAINTMAGNHIGIKEKSLDDETSISDLHFVQSKGTVELPKYQLPGDLYNLVQKSFQQSKDGSRCDVYFSKEPEKKDGPVIDAEEVRREMQ